MSDTPTQAVDTNGWDTVSAITYADVNAAIAASPNKPTSFSVAASDNSASASGSFGAWALRLGGAGGDIQMEVQITGGSVTIGTTAYPISACAFPFMLRAAYVPHVPGSSVQDLIPAATAPVNVMSYDQTQGNPTGNMIANAALQELLQQWMTANLNTFNTVFASVDLDADYGSSGVNWLQPSYHGYAVAEPTVGATLQNSVFGVLTLIDGVTTPPSNLSYAVSPYAIPSGADAAFVISAEKFLQHMMLIAVPYMFKGITSEDPSQNFTIDNDGMRIRNTTAVTLTDTKLDNGRTVNPTIQPSNFTIEVNGTELVITVEAMSFTYSPGIEVTLVYTNNATLSLDTTNWTLQLSTTGQTGSGSAEVTKGMNIAQICLGVAAILMTIISAGGGVVAKACTTAVSTATEGAIEMGETVGENAEQEATNTVSALKGLISGTPGEVSELGARISSIAKVAVIGAFATGAVPAIAQIIDAVADGKNDSCPQITTLTNYGIGKTVIWPEAVGTFNLASAQLNGALQFGLTRAS